MFEHLGPRPETKMKKVANNLKAYFSFLFIAVAVFTFIYSVKSGSESQAQEQFSNELSAQLVANSDDSQVVYQMKNVSVFDFVINVNKSNTTLYKLVINVNGLYSFDLLDNLKLFHEGVQLGATKEMDKQGNIYFNLKDYPLKKGQNFFSLFLADSQAQIDDILQLSIDSPDDIFLAQSGHLFRPRGDFPITGGLISFIEQGQLIAYNNTSANNYFVSTNELQNLASFILTTNSEVVDVQKIIITYQELNEDFKLEEAKFILKYNNKKIAESNIFLDNKEIVFNLDQLIVLPSNSSKIFDLFSLNLPFGDYRFDLKDVQGKGVVSGGNIGLAQNMKLNSITARDDFLKLEVSELDTKISNGWNKLYNLKIKASGAEKINLHKLTWNFESQGLDFIDAELWVDDQPYISNLILKDNKISIKTNGQKPLLVDSQGLELMLLAKLKLNAKYSKIETYLLIDKQSSTDDLEGNFVWSNDNQFYNSYKLPYLPLEPSILAN